MVDYEMERVMRIELTYRAWEASVLPLNYTRLGNWIIGARRSVLPGWGQAAVNLSFKGCWHKPYVPYKLLFA